MCERLGLIEKIKAELAQLKRITAIQTLDNDFVSYIRDAFTVTQ
jgi:DNA-binding transcriptional regulator YiaG